MYTCLFCAKVIVPGRRDPCALHVTGNADRPRDAQTAQTFFCHAACLRDRAKIHAANFYFMEPDFPTVGELSSAQTPHTHPDDAQVHVQSIQGDPLLAYSERIGQLALFFFELAEEGNDAHSDAIKAQLPVPNVPWKALQTRFRADWFGTQGLTLTDGALACQRWLVEQGAVAEHPGDVDAAIRAVCLPYERPFAPVTDPAIRLDRAYVRLARLFRRSLREDFSEHSRAVEWCVPNAVAPQNIGVPGQHPEHVVPCAVLRDIARERYGEPWSVRQVATLLRSLLVVIWIDEDGRVALDNGSGNLRSAMPKNWVASSGCIYARLHDKGILFQPAPGYACSCSATGQALPS
jgi:hypothetical protein